MKRIIRYMAVLMTAACLLAGCALPGSSQPELSASGISVNKKGMITQVIVEDFSQSYYNADELKGQIEEQIKAISGDSEKPPVRLTGYELSEDKTLRVQIEFDSADLYTEFNRKELYLGTVAKAIADGYTLPSFTGPDKAPIGPDAAASMGEKKIVIFEEPLQVSLPDKIVAASDNVTITEEKLAAMQQQESEGEKGYIVY